MSLCGVFHYDSPAEKMTTVGLTGTKGKTTVAYFIKASLDLWERAQGKINSALFSTVATFIGEEKIPSRITTPEALELQKNLAAAADCGTEYLTMEVSSQGLKYGRVDGVTYDIGCFLNIGYDHISSVEHPDYDDYFYSKLKLFDISKKCVLNLDTDRYDEVAEYVKGRADIVTFSTRDESADVFGYNIRKEGDEIRFSVRINGEERPFKLSTPGFFNVDNALAAISVLTLIGVPYEYMYEGIASTSVEGRMELHRSADGKYNAIVDFAHNTMSYEALAKSAKREFPDKKIVFIFGCPGNKAFNRRHDLADAAGRHSDYIYITEDDTASESFESISEQIAKNVEATGCPYTIIEDRETAIRTALDEMGESSVLLIAGKGNETNQRTADGYKDYITDAGAVEKYFAEHYTATAVTNN
jgi:UDP-N-acetylmuramoyl-L-alanyl-D-glutamate--2,6-diaminopimelate ligase